MDLTFSSSTSANKPRGRRLPDIIGGQVACGLKRFSAPRENMPARSALIWHGNDQALALQPLPRFGEGQFDFGFFRVGN